MLKHARAFPQVFQVLPKRESEIDKLPRWYIANVIYTLVGPVFKEWVDSIIEERNQKIAKEQDLMIDMDPEVYKAFQACQHVSGK